MIKSIDVQFSPEQEQAVAWAVGKKASISAFHREVGFLWTENYTYLDYWLKYCRNNLKYKKSSFQVKLYISWMTFH